MGISKQCWKPKRKNHHRLLITVKRMWLQKQKLELQFIKQNKKNTMGTIGITDGGWLNSPLGTEAIAGALSNFNKVTASDLEQLKNATSFKIKLKKEFGKYKVGDILQVKSIRNLSQSEPPNFIVIEEKLGAQKYSSGGRGWLQNKWFENYDGQEPSKQSVIMSTKEVYNNDKEYAFWTSLGFTQSDMISPKVKGRFYLVVALVAGYFVYKKFKK